MKPERIGLTMLDLELFEWVVLLKTGVQAVQRTYAFALHHLKQSGGCRFELAESLIVTKCR